MKKEYIYYKIFFSLLIIILVLTACATAKTNLVLQNPKELGVEEQINEISVTLKINNGQNEESFEHNIQEGKTAFDLMKELQSNGSIEFVYEESNVGVFVNSINNIENNIKDNIFWMFYVNDKMAGVGIGAYDLQNKDVIEWKYINTTNIDF